MQSTAESIAKVSSGLTMKQLHTICGNLSTSSLADEVVFKKELQALIRSFHATGVCMAWLGTINRRASLNQRLFIQICRSDSSSLFSSIPDVRWEDLGGMEEAKREINDLISLPLKFGISTSGEINTACTINDSRI